MTKCLLIAGTHSGVGKTTVSVGLLTALRRRGLSVQPFKVGPDYLDPTFHAVAAERPCRNLDTWMMPTQGMRQLFAQACREVDFAVIEGVMGVFDGLGYDGDTASTAEVAKLLGAPVVLVVDASKMARSAAALALGFQRFDPDLPLAGFVVNRVGSAAHGRGVAAAIEQTTGLPVFGCLPREERLRVPERHLGLVPALAGFGSDYIQAAGDLVTQHLDLERLLSCTRDVAQAEERQHVNGNAPRARPIIAVARDEAFHFTYEENLELLRAAGATLAFFSPLRDAALPPGTAGIILSGGFPELHAGLLAANTSMHEQVRAAHERGLPIYAECGGLMYLTQAIVDLEGREHRMVGLLPGRSVMKGQLTLGYRLARAAGASWLLEDGATVRGHEFHYSNWDERPADLPPAYHLFPPAGAGEPRPEGAALGNLWASYVHLHFWGKPELAERFVAACRSVSPLSLWERGRG